MRLRPAAALLGIAIAALGAAPSEGRACPGPALAAGLAAWERRADGAPDDGSARPEPAARAVDAFEQAVREDAGCLAAHERLLRALFFAGEYASPGADERRARFERARLASDTALDRLARRAGLEPGPDVFAGERLRASLPEELHEEAAGIHFWSAVGLASWAREHGILAAVRAGIAGRVRDHALASLALAPAYEDGGAHRILAALHGELPRVPLLTGWVDPARALPEAERAFALAPDRAANQLFLGLSLLDRAPERRDEGLALVARVAALEPEPGQRVEELALRRLARERSAREREAR